jgi:hypothetical protein
MELTFTVASATNTNIFTVFAQDIQDVVDTVNFLIRRGKKGGAESKQVKKQKDDFWKYI